MTRSSCDTAPTDTVYVGNHVVCVIDLLGQKEKLKTWCTLPDTPTLPEAFTDGMKRTAGAVNWFLKAFEDYYSQFDVQNLEQSQIHLLTEAQQSSIDRARDCTLRTHHLSDTFVFDAPLENTHGDFTPTPLYRMLGASAMAMLCSLAGSVALRGAITVGVGTRLDNGTFYGPALAEAHRLETEIADYPRVILSNTAIAAASRKGRFSTDEATERLLQQAAVLCREFLCGDDDGRIMVDFLGKHMRSLCDSDHATFVEQAYRFVNDEYRRWAQQKGQERLAGRYHRLRAYMETRLSHWGLSSEGLGDAR